MSETPKFEDMAAFRNWLAENRRAGGWLYTVKKTYAKAYLDSKTDDGRQ